MLMPAEMKRMVSWTVIVESVWTVTMLSNDRMRSASAAPALPTGDRNIRAAISMRTVQASFLTAGTRFIRGLLLVVERNLWCYAFLCARQLEELSFLKAEHACNEDRRERLAHDVVVPHRAIVVTARHLDLVLQVCKLRLQVEEVGVGLEFRVSFCNSEQGLQCAIQLILSGGLVRDTGCAHGAGTHLGDVGEYLLLVAGKSLDRLDKVRDEVVTALQLDVHARPGLVFHGALADELVVDANEPHDDENNDCKSDNPTHCVFLPLLVAELQCHPMLPGACP